MTSLRTRVLLSASVVLVTALGCASVLLDRAFRESALNAVEDRLRGRIYMLIGAADFDAPSTRPLVGELPDSTLSMPGSGNYVRILSDNGKTRWQSRSLLGLSLPLPRRIQAALDVDKTTKKFFIDRDGDLREAARLEFFGEAKIKEFYYVIVVVFIILLFRFCFC